MDNFLNKNKSKPKKSENKEIVEKEEMPKGELKETGLFPKNMFMIDKDLVLSEMPAILSWGDKNSYNSMVIAHGSLGVGFGKPIFTVYVKPERYTYEFMEKTKKFTVSYIDKKLYKKFTVYGSKSGRDVNKEEVSGSHIVFMDNGGITFQEAVEVYVCKLIVKSYVDEKNVAQEILDTYNDAYQRKLIKSKKLHAMYIGEIIGHYRRE